MAGLNNKLNPNSKVLTDRGYVSAAEAEYQHSQGTLNIIGRNGRAVNSQELVLDPLEPTAQQRITGNLESLIGIPALQAGDLYKEFGGFGSTLDNKTGIQSSQEMFNETYADALANEAMANVLETQGVPDNISREDYFARMGDTLASLGLPSTAAEYENINENALLTPDLYSDIDPESIETDDSEKENVPDDLEQKWDAVDKTKDLAAIFQDALDIFGAYDRNSIRKVVKVVNDRGVSAQEVARITGNTVESINQAAAESDTAITNQGITGGGTGDTGTGDTGAGDTGDVFNEATDTLNTGEVLTTGAPEAIDTTVPSVITGGGEVAPDNTPVKPDDISVIPVLDTPVIVEDPAVIVDDTPILPTIMQPTPKQTTNISLFQSIQDTPITDSLFFEPKFTELDNIPVGMFERFLQATGGR
ncbi:MAG: hypothetical protein CMJ25_11735 [Phycisphaerae bacterium]|nr:hypothetical protein [Phycisphaerae bacterium]